MRCRKSICTATLLTVALCSAGRNAEAVIIKEGSAETLRYGYGTTAGGIDANTTHLWRFDESGVPFADSTTVAATAIPLQNVVGTTQQNSVLLSAGGAANSARRINTSASGSNVIRAFANVATTDDNLTADQFNSFFGASGAFTLDFLVRPDFNPGSTPNVSAGIRIFSQEGLDAGEPNTFSLTWLATNKLQLSATPTGIDLDIPLAVDDANAFTAAGQWFHVGISYNGNEGVADNMSFYWTLVDGPDTALAVATTSAHLAGTYTFATDPVPVTSGPGPEWNFGNRPTGGRAFQGALDEFRISNVARGASDFIFAAPATQPGDHNGDGLVDAADYVYWRKNDGSNEQGYLDWRANFGVGGGIGSGQSLYENSSTVPEPCLTHLAVIGALLLGARRPINRCM